MYKPFDLSGKTALVTGGNRGIGLGMATAFASEGMKLVLADVDVEGMESARKLLVEGGAEVIAAGSQAFVHPRTTHGVLLDIVPG